MVMQPGLEPELAATCIYQFVVLYLLCRCASAVEFTSTSNDTCGRVDAA